MPPVTPKAMRGPGPPALLRSSDPSARRLTVLHPRPVGRVGLRRHLGHLLDGILLGERPVAVRYDAGKNLLHGDSHRLSGCRFDARPRAALQLLAALARHAD